MIAKTITTIPTALPDKKGTKIEDCTWFEKEKIYNTTKHNKLFFAKKNNYGSLRIKIISQIGRKLLDNGW